VLNQFFAIPAALVVAATGIYQVDKFNFDYGNFWLSATIAIDCRLPGEHPLLHPNRQKAPADHREGRSRTQAKRN
jgi:hypothetical protein